MSLREREVGGGCIKSGQGGTPMDRTVPQTEQGVTPDKKGVLPQTGQGESPNKTGGTPPDGTGRTVILIKLEKIVIPEDLE